MDSCVSCAKVSCQWSLVSFSLSVLYCDCMIVVIMLLRDIPMPLVTSGVEHGNLRELALARMKDLGTECRDVRTREVGIQEIHHKVRPYEVSLHYDSSSVPSRIRKLSVPKINKHRLSSSGVTTQLMVAGRHSFPMKTPNKIFSSAC